MVCEEVICGLQSVLRISLWVCRVCLCSVIRCTVLSEWIDNTVQPNFIRWVWNYVDLTSVLFLGAGGGGNDIQWCFSQVKGAVDDDVAEGKNKF